MKRELARLRKLLREAKRKYRHLVYRGVLWYWPIADLELQIKIVSEGKQDLRDAMLAKGALFIGKVLP